MSSSCVPFGLWHLAVSETRAARQSASHPDRMAQVAWVHGFRLKIDESFEILRKDGAPSIPRLGLFVAPHKPLYDQLDSGDMTAEGGTHT